MNKSEGMVLSHNFLVDTMELSNEQFGALMHGLIEYGINGELTAHKEKINGDSVLKDKFEMALEKVDFFIEDADGNMKYYKY